MISAQSSSWDEPYNCESLSNEGFQAENNIHPRISSYIIWIRKEKNDFFVGPHIIRIYFLAGSCNDPSVRKEQTLTIYGEKVNGRYPENTHAYITCTDFAGNVTCKNGAWNMPHQCRCKNNIYYFKIRKFLS